jgi:peptidoglycan/xylan/chitin deacetylase (PgdA/CDA1 family)
VADLTIVTYHSLDDTDSPISVRPATFARHAAWLAQQKFCALTLSESLERLRAGTLPPKAVALTFDDGFLNTAAVGLPILKAHGLTGTVFLVSAHVGKHNDFAGQSSAAPRLPLMDWAAVRDLRQAGWEIGAHTCSHPDLTRLSVEDAELELRTCRDVIEQRLGEPVRSFAYPYGRQGSREREIAGRIYAAAVSTTLGVVRSSSHLLALERVDAYYLSRPDLVRLLGGRLLPAYLQVRQMVRTMRGIT